MTQPPLLARARRLLHSLRGRASRGRRLEQVPVILQGGPGECGVTCLEMLLAYYGRPVASQVLGASMGVTAEGTTALAMLDAARRFGLAGEGVGLDASAVDDLPLPAILHCHGEHFVVLESWHGDAGSLIDPSVGRYAVMRDQLRQLFSGVALIFQPEDD